MSEADTPRSIVRFHGLDFARSLAILGMVLVNFTAITDEGESPEWLLFLLGTIQGRAAAIFVVLAGVGISLLSRRARLEQSAVLFREVRITLLKRAVFLLILGVMLIPIWPPDILHFYALYLTAATLVLPASSRSLWGMTILMMLGFCGLFLLFDYDAGWSEEGSYAGFFTVAGTIRRMFFNGYYPFLPWIAFLLAGMWLGRQDLGDGRALKRILWVALIIAASVQAVSWYLTGLSDFVEIESKTPALNLLGTDPYPPGPLFVITSIGFAFMIVIFSLKFAAAYPTSWPTRIFVPTGQIALSIYFAHATGGLFFLSILSEVYGQSASLAAATALGFCLASMVFAVLWRLRFERGPVEILMRKLTGSS